jgi:citrate lyase beta subunit
MSAAVLDAPAVVDDPVSCKWRTDGEFALVHPTGWTIARYTVYDEWRYLLWEPVDRCTGANSTAAHGPFNDVRDAMRLHRQLVPQKR